MLHLEITVERIQREFSIDIIATSPSVVYKVLLKDGTVLEIDNPARYPDPAEIAWVEEPWVKSHIVLPADYLGAVMNLAMEKRGEYLLTETLDPKRLLLTYRFPLNEIITDFNDKLKSITRGHGSYDYEFDRYSESPICKVEILVNEKLVNELSFFAHREKAEARGRTICSKLKEEIPRQLFKVPIQAAIGGKIIARETLSAMGKDVTAKCYGGDITRKRKLWEKQKKGKLRMKQIGDVQIPQSAFIIVLKS